MKLERIKKKRLSDIVIKIAEKAAYKSCDSACFWWQYQPKVPTVLKKGNKEYKVISSSESKLMEENVFGKKVFELRNLEVLLAQDFVIRNLSEETIDELSEEVAKKYKEKKKNVGYGTVTDVFYKVLDATCDDPHAKEQFSTMAAKATYVYTPKGSAVSVYERGEIYSPAQIAEMNSYMDNLYPSATRLATATSRYNCHSYAWYSQSTSNNRSEERRVGKECM